MKRYIHTEPKKASKALNRTILVTGADHRQGLAVVRGLGMAGYRVIAAGSHPRSIGFYSKFAAERFRYTSPFRDKTRFVDDVLLAVRKTHPKLILPAAESTLVALDQRREEIESHAPLAAPASHILELSLNKELTMELAEAVGIRVPVSIRANTVVENISAARKLNFPVAVKPRVPRLFGHGHEVNIKVQYMKNMEELRTLLVLFGKDLAEILIQEFVFGHRLAVNVVCRDGEPLLMNAYMGCREVPLTGGVSTLRKTVPLNVEIKNSVKRLLRKMGWHGVAMVEFKHNPNTKENILMEVNGRITAGVALELDAGLNIPSLTAALFLDEPLPNQISYKLGVRERWLRGDLNALRRHFLNYSSKENLAGWPYQYSSKAQVLWDFISGIRPGDRYDEFKIYDLMPGLVEAASLIKIVVYWTLISCLSVARAIGVRFKQFVVGF